MATIKFISEYKCYLYIDAEYVDLLEPNQLKKIDLASGSYFIEIKNEDKVSIKSYILDVKEGQNQILQQIFNERESLEVALNNLKNDYNVRFFNQRLKFKYKNKYGYINSRFQVVINPQYIEAEDFTNGKALVKQTFSCVDKVTVIDTEGNMCYERWFDFVGEDDNTILLHNNNFYYVINKLDYSII